MRLIDANELIEIVKGSEELLDFQKDELIACVDACDTAYDVERVVSELEDKSAMDIFDKDWYVRKNEAIKIVRKGGME